eukprot:TRINITY_DN1885_c0_g1_i2.p1 TRINITY_DN1885_c0_g1~~TRINITY_DN1885_c0_g1_i2.p1  ORF type:complete len:258 (-),score=23.67 TRINITY_DN1885_c0_g1_i2:411-1184(-)
MDSSNAKVEAYVSLGKSLKGVALVDLIKKAIEEPGLFYFSEILDLPQIKELKTGDNVGWVRALELFAYGTWRDYKTNIDNFPQFTDPQILKLKQLTVAGLALSHQILEYSVLSCELEMQGGMRALEDFIIKECIYCGVIKGKLDQRNACIHITQTVGRDVRRDQLSQISSQLNQWMEVSSNVICGIEECLAELKSEKLSIHNQRKMLEEQVEAVRQQVQQDKDTEDVISDSYMDIKEGVMEPLNSRNKRKKPKRQKI